ncbi:hypothetical protein Tdes44962_MAKER02257 [Teratosphaeria destructans]|uniref:Uncharacterized protein n=1 Tax=Teratosphaeria destructans TaxID=418781 RepID=A0A9W7SUZ3_9PEZI|nr:hypothetical protein Tdes44962_MAKER02257 [Teratosphaeria destructans]
MACHDEQHNFPTMDGPERYGTEGPTRANSPELYTFDFPTMDGPERYGTEGPTRPNTPESTSGHVCSGPWECEASDCFCRKLVEELTEEGLVDVLLDGDLSDGSDWTDLGSDSVSLSDGDYGNFGDDECQLPDEINHAAESSAPHSARPRNGVRNMKSWIVRAVTGVGFGALSILQVSSWVFCELN